MQVLTEIKKKSHCNILKQGIVQQVSIVTPIFPGIAQEKYS